MIPIALLKSPRAKGIQLFGDATTVGPVEPVLTSVTVTPQGGAAAGHPVTFGLPLGVGRFPYEDSLIAKIGGTVIPIQVDRKSYHSIEPELEYSRRDQGVEAYRSVAHVIVSLELPSAVADSSSVQIDLEIADTPPTTQTQLAWTPMTCSIELDIGGTVWTSDLSGTIAGDFTSPIKAGNGTAPVQEWLSGAVCREWIVQAPFMNSSSEHADLDGRFHIRQYADGATRVNAIVENNRLVTTPTSYDYDVTVKVNGNTRYSDTLSHFTHSRWVVEVFDTWVGDNHVIFDPAYLTSTQAIPNYDLGLAGNLSAEFLTDFTDASWAAAEPSITAGVISFPKMSRYTVGPSNGGVAYESSLDRWEYSIPRFGPTSIGDTVNAVMSAVGGHIDIGPVPFWTAEWIIDQTYSSYKVMKGIGYGAMSWPTHFRDPETDIAVSSVKKPALTINQNVIPHLAIGSHSPTSKTPYSADTAHCPSLAYVPYLITGDYCLLEEIQFFGSYATVWCSPAYRGDAQCLVQRAMQQRGAAWSLRNIAHAAMMTSDDHPLKEDYMRILDNNRIEYNRCYLSDETKTNTYGMAIDYTPDISPPWMDDFLTWSVTHLVELGFISWSPFARWKGKYTVSRMGYDAGAGGKYCYTLGTAYRLRIAPYDMGANTAPLVTIDNGGTLIAGAPRSPRIVFKNIEDVATASNNATSGISSPDGYYATYTGACGTQLMADEVGVSGPNRMVGYEARFGSCANMRPALAAAVTMGTNEAALAQTRFNNRDEAYNFTNGPGWAINPRVGMRISSDPYTLDAIAPA